MKKHPEPGTVPNGTKKAERAGRPPSVTDDELVHIVEALANAEGRVPTLDAIIQTAGRCQRSRAVKARHAYAEKLASREIQMTLKLPETMELAHRKLMAQWHQIAHEQAILAIKAQLRSAEERAMDAEMAAHDARERLDAALQEKAALLRDVEAANAQAEASADRLAQTLDQLARSEAIAEERASVIKQLTDI